MSTFWSKVAVDDDDDKCWPWVGRLDRYGYGRVGGNTSSRTGSTLAHRAAWVFGSGRAVPADMHVLHSCHNRACCNPAHLRAGTHEDNMRDLSESGRVRGARHSKARLSVSDVVEIRRRRHGGERLQSIADDFAVTPNTVSSIARGITWKGAA